MFKTFRICWSNSRQICTHITNYAKQTVSSDTERLRYIKSSKKLRGQVPGMEIPPGFYGGRHIVTMLPGRGIGPELMVIVRDIIDFVHAPVDFEIMQSANLTKEDVRNKIMSIKRNGTCIKGNIEAFGLEQTLLNSPNIAIRKKLDLHVSLSVLKSYPIPTTRYKKDIDIILIRQNTEGEYTMIEHEAIPGYVESMKVCTVFNTERLAHWAFKFCRTHGRKTITVVHKANIMKMSDGLFMHTVRDVGKQYPDIKVNDMIVDNCCMQIVSNPYQFDVMVTPNLYGLIIANLLSGMIGSAGLTASRNYGEGVALFETATRNSGTSIVGKNLANPIAILLATIDLLNHLGHVKEASLIETAIKKTIEDKIFTPDIGGEYGTSDVVLRIKEHIAKGIREKPPPGKKICRF